MAERVPVLVIGAGQAGLAVSHELSGRGVEHVVLERGRVGQTWRGRWDSFCLVSPNWTVQLPGGAYAGDDPDGFMPRDEIVRHLERWAGSFSAPVREGVEVTELARDDGGFRLDTSEGELRAGTVVVCSGAYQRPHRPASTADLPSRVLAIDAEQYTNPQALPPGGVLVVGSGQTGCQLAEEIFESGRHVTLACGRAPWVPRRLGDEDVFHWLARTPFMEQRLSDLPSPAARLGANPQATGHERGHDLHYRTLQKLGVRLVGRLRGFDSERVHLVPDLADSVEFGDARYRDFGQLVATTCERLSMAMPDLPEPEPFVCDPPESLGLEDFATVIFTSGFRPDYGRWVRLPEAFDEMGFPITRDGASVAADGLYFAGVHFMRKRKSSLLFGVGEDAAVIAEDIRQRVPA